MKRSDDFTERRSHLAGLSETELEALFWARCGQIIGPMLDLARKNTTPSIERSVLLRMGFSSQEATKIVAQTIEKGMMGKGCGHLVYRLAREKGLSLREAGELLGRGEGYEELRALFGGTP
ncbi:D-Ornithine 4,5-aminomutase S subunit [Clostridiaceae bacterium JG1575]|nr:D-Ornithine 4,5-aminomutase S subunit [Clostridiaceae bacterium JG1575]